MMVRCMRYVLVLICIIVFFGMFIVSVICVCLVSGVFVWVMVIMYVFCLVV